MDGLDSTKSTKYHVFASDDAECLMHYKIFLIYNEMRYINLRFTYLLTYLMMYTYVCFNNLFV